MKHGEGSGKKKDAPGLEAHFTDGAWYDINLLAFDPTKKRFQVQVPPFALTGFNNVCPRVWPWGAHCVIQCL